MRDYFAPGLLPGGDGLTTPTDIATWEQIWEAARAVHQLCIEKKNMAGWDSVGM